MKTPNEPATAGSQLRAFVASCAVCGSLETVKAHDVHAASVLLEDAGWRYSADDGGWVCDSEPRCEVRAVLD